MKSFICAMILGLAPSLLFAGTINGSKKISSGAATPMTLWLYVEGEPNTVYRFNIGQSNVYSVPGLALPMLNTLTDKKPSDIKCSKFTSSKNAAGVTVYDCDDIDHVSISMPALN